MKKVLLKLIYLYKKDPSLNSFSIHESKSISQKTIMNVVYIVTLYVVPLPIFVSFSLSHSIMFYNGKNYNFKFCLGCCKITSKAKINTFGKKCHHSVLPFWPLRVCSSKKLFPTVLRNLKYCEVLSFFPCTYSRYKMLQGYLVALAGVLKCAYAPPYPQKILLKKFTLFSLGI